MKPTQTTSIVFDRDIYDGLCLQAGRYGQSTSKHLNIILSALDKWPKKDLDALVEKGLVIMNKKKWSD